MISINQLNKKINKFMNTQRYREFQVVYNVKQRTLSVGNHDNSQNIKFLNIRDVTITDLLRNVFNDQTNQGSEISFYFQ